MTEENVKDRFRRLIPRAPRSHLTPEPLTQHGDVPKRSPVPAACELCRHLKRKVRRLHYIEIAVS